MVHLTEAQRLFLRAQVDDAKSVAVNINLLGRVLKGASKSGAQLSEIELIREGLIAELILRELRGIIQGQNSAALEPSLIIRTVHNVFNYLSLWAVYYNEQVIRQQLDGYDLRKFASLEELRKKLIDDIEGKLFWEKYFKAGVMTCVLVAASAIAITSAGFGAPVSAFLIAQFTASPTIATTLAAGSMVLATSGIMCLDSGVRRAWKMVRSFGNKAKLEPPSLPVEPTGVLLAEGQAPDHQRAKEKPGIVTKTGEASQEKESVPKAQSSMPITLTPLKPKSKTKDTEVKTHGRHLRTAGVGVVQVTITRKRRLHPNRARHARAAVYTRTHH